MPVDFQQINAKIREIGAGAAQRKRILDERGREAARRLKTYNSRLEFLRTKVEAAKAVDPGLRCALPLREPLDASFPPPSLPADVTLIAADGSQINPDRHASLQFGLVNVGAVTMRVRSGDVPEIKTDSDLLYGEDLETDFGTMSEGMVALRRDLKERELLAELAGRNSGAVVTLTDGPVELWGAKGEDARSFDEFVIKYKSVLSRLASSGAAVAGYVDKPAADLVCRLLEIAAMPEEVLKHAQAVREYRPLRGVADRMIYGADPDPLLPPGHRSAVFGLQSVSEKTYTGILALHFFYLNVGTQGHPWLARVELPKWIVDDPGKLELVHAALVQQCGIMGSKPYPYLLHRAHETAVVRLQEKDQVEQLLTLELRRQGEHVPEGSAKQAAKDSASDRRSY